MDGRIEVASVVEAVQKGEGAGARVRRLFPTHRMKHLDPFVLLDEFSVTPPAAFPDHPHGGFEGVTYMLHGAFRHRDNIGNDQTVWVGGAQRFTAGKRIVHSELPGSDEISRGLQLWVKLPRRLMDIAPDYQAVPAQDIPEKEEKGILIRTVVGAGSPVMLHTKVQYFVVTVEGGTSFQDHIPEDWNGLIYVLEGEITLADVIVNRGGAAVFRGGGQLNVGIQRSAHFALIAGEPHGEPIRHRGSFVR